MGVIKPVDLDAIRERVNAASPGPWLDGDVWLVAGVGFGNGRGRCACCHLGEPVWSGLRDINGTIMQAHRHLAPEPYGAGHRISSADGGTVAGLYGYESGGIVDVDDQRFILHARQDVPALLDEVALSRVRVAELVTDRDAWRADRNKLARECADLRDAANTARAEERERIANWFANQADLWRLDKNTDARCEYDSAAEMVRESVPEAAS